MALIDVQRSIVELCFGAVPDAALYTRIGDARRLQVYREAIRARLRAELEHALPRTRAAVGRPAFERAFDHFLAAQPPRTRFFHAVVECFAESAGASLRAGADLPAYLADLCAYEAALWSVSDAVDDIPAACAEFSFECRPRLAPALRLLALAHAVHEPPAADGGYAARPVYLCLHRRAEETQARTWNLNAVSYRLMQRMLPGNESVAESVKQVAQERSVVIDQGFLDGLCTVLADFIERGIILGGH